jgi:hypothetical protein
LGLSVEKPEVVRAVVVFYGARIEFLRSTLAG